MVSYQGRKSQRVGKDDKYIESSGIEYNGSDQIIGDLFTEKRMNEAFYTMSGIEKVKKSYIYIISKRSIGEHL